LEFALSLILGVEDCVFRTSATVFGLEENPEDTPPLEKKALLGIDGRL
jgi:hypothetical protein